MRRTFRAVLSVTLVAVLVIDPVTACSYCGYSSGYYTSYSAPCGGYYEPAGCCGSYAYEVADCGSCGCDGGGCEGFGCDGEVVYEGDSYQAAPQGMHEESPEPMTHSSGTADVRRPVDEMPAPQLSPETTPERSTYEPRQPAAAAPPPVAPPADDSYRADIDERDELADDMFAPAEPMRPPADQPAAMPDTMPAPDDRYPPAVETPSEPADDMFAPFDEEPAMTEEPTMTDEPATEEPSAEEPPVEEPADDSDFDSIFGAPTDAAPPAEEEPVDEQPAEEESAPAEEEDDLFNFGQILREPGGLASTSLRRWIDNTGNYSCRGRLIRTRDGKVQLLKDNGRTTTVEIGRLSQNDLEFVHRQASAQRSEALSRTAQVTPLRSAR